MKRCPDCGFRSKEVLKTCPLCGVRMREDPGLNQTRYTGHVHQEKGEKCLLPNTGKDASARAHYQKMMEQQLNREKTKKAKSGQSDVQKTKSKQIAGIVVAFILYALLEACGA